MGDFIIITLMVSSFWLLWEIIRVVSMEWLNRDEITLPAGELGRSELLRCADSFEQLSGMFQGMVTKKEELSGQDMDEVLFRVQTSVCRSCSAAAQCWDYGSETGICRFNRIAESIIQGKELNNGRKEALQKQCLHGDFFFEAVADQIEKARMDMLWHNRLMESRSAAADQLHETACIIRKAAGHICDQTRRREHPPAGRHPPADARDDPQGYLVYPAAKKYTALCDTPHGKEGQMHPHKRSGRTSVCSVRDEADAG